MHLFHSKNGPLQLLFILHFSSSSPARPLTFVFLISTRTGSTALARSPTLKSLFLLKPLEQTPEENVSINDH